MALPVGPQRAEEVDPPESGPVGIAEVELRVRALPEQEAAEALLARGPDDQVWIRLAGRIQVLGDVLDVQYLGKFLDCRAPAGVLLQQGPDRVRDLTPPAVADRDVDQQAIVARGRLRGILQGAGSVSRQQVESAHRLDVVALSDQFADSVLDDAQQGLKLGCRPGQVVGREQPQGDDLDAGLLAPLEQLEDLVSARLVPAADVGQASPPSPPPVTVAHHPDVPGNRLRRQGRLESVLVQPVDETAESHPAPFLAAASAASPCRQVPHRLTDLWPMPAAPTRYRTPRRRPGLSEPYPRMPSVRQKSGQPVRQPRRPPRLRSPRAGSAAICQ